MNKRVCCFVVFALMSELVVSCVWSQENQIINSEFDDDLNAWGSYGGAGFTIEVVRDAGLSGKNAGVLDVTDASAATAIGISQNGLLLERGVTYPIGFTAYAEEARTMVVLLQTRITLPSGRTWPTQVNEKVELTTTPQDFVLEYTHTGDTLGDEAGERVTLYLMLKGSFWPMTGDDLNKKVWFDRVFFGAEPVPPRRDRADDPIPGDQSTDVPRVTDLSWQPGIYANTHNVYLGTQFDDVNTADPSNPLGVLVSQGQEAMSYGPESVFDFEQTYYWRVDEVNGAPDFTVYKGDVWSFEVEPLSIPISNITATASSSFGISGPEKTVDGSGLVDDLHGVSAADMWISAGVPAAIEYAFDRAYKLHELWIWNSNQLIEAFVGFGAKDVVIEHSLDGENWTVLDGVGPLAQATGTGGYAHNSTIDFAGAVAQYVRVTVNSVQGIAPQASLSEVRFYYIPVNAREPQPDAGAMAVGVEETLRWRSGREADRHELYFGTDFNSLSLAGTVNENSFDTLALDLQLGQTHYWRIDEVNDAMDPSTWMSDVWSFTTVDSLVIDDMEGYADEEFLEIWATWVDGFGDEANNGALVGANPAIGDFSPESTIVHGDNQSLPIHYDNSGAAQSEATRTFDAPMDWTGHGVASLSLYFRGGSENSGGQFYVKINNTKILYDGDAGDLSRPIWQPWNIDLSTAGGNLMNVTSLTIGVDGAGVTGVVYIDDIGLYPLAPQFTVPAEPDAANLVARYTFDGNANDTSGNGHNGTSVGAVTFVNDPVRGQVVSLPGGDDQYISIDGVGISGNMPRTIACWAKADSTTITNWTLIFGFTGTAAGGGGDGSHFNIGSLGGPGGVGAHVWGWEETIFSDEAALEWHHYAMTYDGTTIGYYGDGVPMDSDVGKSNVRDLSASSDRVHVGSRITQTSSFPGSVDDAVIYSVTLTDDEIAWLAGRTAPIHRGF